MFSFFILLSIVKSQSVDGCSDASSLQCFNELEQLQSAQQCGSVKLVLNERMGHLMPVPENWMSCACEKLPAIIDCLDQSSCPDYQDIADDFSGVVMHCGMDTEMNHSNQTNDSASITSTSNTSSQTPLETPKTQSDSNNAIVFGASVYLLLVLALA